MSDETAWVASFLLDGHSMMSTRDIYQEFSDKMIFPDYFGYNMNALYDMLTDLAWLSFSELRITIKDHNLILCLEEGEGRKQLLELLDNVKVFWATPIAEGEWWDIPAIDFELVLPD